MSERDLSDVLLLIPCCGSKKGDGRAPAVGSPVLESDSTSPAGALLEEGRRLVAERYADRFDFGSPLLPAMVLYTGNPYKLPGFRERLDSAFGRGMRCLIVSAGYGVVRPDEPIHKYNLQMAQTLPIWKRRLPQILAGYISRNGVKRVFGALSDKYSEAVADVQGQAPDVEFHWCRPRHPRGTPGSAMQEVPKKLGLAVIDLVTSGFKPDARWANSLAGRPSSPERAAVAEPTGGQTGETDSRVPQSLGDAGPPRNEYAPRAKYGPLRQHLASVSAGQTRVELTFHQIERVLGIRLPPTARQRREWWGNESAGSHVQAAAWREAGWMVESLDLRGERVTFVRIRAGSGRRGI
jgi:Peroxide stress protein YaaA